MRRSAKSSRTGSRLSQPLDRQLNLYALAASAAGVSLLALAQPTEAKVVYTKTHQIIGINGIYELDLNHDGTVDFLILQCCGGGSTSFRSNGLFAKEALGDAVEGSIVKHSSQSLHFASALKHGARIGPKKRFLRGGYNSEMMAAVTHCCTTGSDNFIGRWLDVKNRYLGLRFKIEGKTHYGWARLSVHFQELHITATLTGYAYETVPNKGITAGQTEGGADGAADGRGPISDDSQTLGRLARGAQGISPRSQP